MSKGFAEWKTKKGQDEQPQRGSTLSFEEYKAAREKGMTEDSIVQTYHPPERMTGKQRAAWNADVIGNNKLAAIAGRGTDGYLRQLQNEDWNSRTYDRSYRQGLGQQIQEADALLGTLKEGSTAYDNTKQYADYLRALQGAFTDREAYFSQFQNEDQYKLVKGVQAAQAKALQNGESYNDYYQRAAKGAERANQAYQAALQRKKQMQQDVNNQRRFFASTGILQVDGQILRGKAAEDYLQQMQDKVNSFDSDPEIQQLARDVQRTQQVASYAEAGRYADLKYRDDFQAKVAAGMTAFQQDKASREAGNMSDSEIARAAAWGAGDPSGLGGLGTAAILKGRQDTSALEPGEGWSEEDLNEFFYLYATNPTEAGERARNLNARDRAQRYAEQAKGVEDWTNQSGWNRLAAWGAGVVSSPANLADYYARAMEYSLHGYVMPHDQMTAADYANTMSAAAARYLNETYTLPENMPVLGGKGLGDAFSLTQSIAQSAATALLGGGATNLLFFGSAANQTFADAKGRGATDGQALALGFLSGTAEVLGETLSVEKLIHLKDPASVRQIIGNLLAQSGVEASEEAFTTVMNTMADALVMGDKSELQQAIRDYMAQGMSQAEAEKRAWNDWTEGVLFDAFGGFLSGGISAGGKMGISSAIHSASAYTGGVQTRGMSKEERQDLRRTTAQEVINYGRLADEGTKARSMADKAQERLDKKGSITNRQAARLSNETAKAIRSADRTTLEDAVRARLQQTGEMSAADLERATKSIVDRVTGDKVEGDWINDQEKQVYTELEAQLSGVSSENWLQADKLKTNQAREQRLQSLRNLELKDSGKTVKVQSAEMVDGKLAFTYMENGERKIATQADLKLDTVQADTLKMLTQILGEDAAAAYNTMNVGSLVNMANGDVFDVMRYASAFATVRDVFGATGVSEERMLASPLRNGLTNGQALQAWTIGKNRGAELRTEQKQSKAGTGEVSLDGVTIRHGDGKTTTYKAVKDQEKVRKSKKFQAVQAIAESLKIDMVLYDGEGGQNIGMYGNGTIYLDWTAMQSEDAKSADWVMFRTLSHELTHFIQQNAKKEYQELRSYITKYLSESKNLDFNDLVAQKMSREYDPETGRLLSYDKAVDEVMADACETMLRDSQYVQDLMQENQSLWEKIRRFIRNFLRKIEASDAAAKELQPVIKELREIWDRGLKTAVESRTGAVSASSTEGQQAVEKLSEGGQKIVESLGKDAEIQVNKDGEMEVAKSADGNTMAFSVKTYEDGGKEKLIRELKKNGHTQEEIDAVIENIEATAEFLEKLAQQYAESSGYENLRRNLYAEISTNLKTGKQAISTLVNNGDYPINLDLQLICKKRVAYMRMLTKLIDDGVFEKVDFKSSAIADLNKILRDGGFETACLGCFVESRRLQLQAWAETIVEEWNTAVDEINPKVGDFNFAKGGNELSQMEIAGLITELENAGKKNDKGNLNLGKGAVAKKMKRLLKKVPSLRQHLTVADLLTPKGMSMLRTYDQNLFSLVKQRYGAASPKIVQDFNPYNGEIADLSFKFVKDMIGESVTGAQAYKDKVKETLKQRDGESKAEYNQRVDDEAIRRYLYDIGGVRIQSFSDFMIENVFDYMQIIADLSAREMPLHGYSKEAIFLRLFGMTGGKFNGSLIAHVEKSMGKEYAGLLPVEEASNGRGIVVEVDGEKYAICFDDYARHVATGSFIQSIGMKDIVALQLDPRYSKNVGSITIGVSNKQIRAMLDSPYFRMVIPYHASGMIKEFAELVGVSSYNDYTKFQTTRVNSVRLVGNAGKVTIEFNEKTGKQKVKNAAGKELKVDTHFDFNEALQRLGDARAAADEYLAWCRDDKNHPVYDDDKIVGYATLTPKFSDVKFKDQPMVDFTQHPNYYKLLEDFNVYDSLGEASAMQGAVTMTLPSEATRLTPEQMTAYKQALRDTGLYTEKEIAKYAKKADMTFQELIAEEVGNRADYESRQAKVWDETVDKAEKMLLEKYGRESAAVDADTLQHSLKPVAPVQPTSNAWSRTHDTAEAMEAYPNLWNVAAEESEKRNPTQIASTQGTYRNIYKILQREGFDGKILDASSGLGLGTKVGREEFGFDVDDIEPYPDASYKPRYTDYSKLHKKYDVIISSAVLNVLPQDQRDALVVKMGELLNPGGRMFITTRGKDVETLGNTGKNIHLGNMEWIETVKGSYQKGFTQAELKAYLEDALGPSFTVELSNAKNGGKFNNNTSIVVTKDAAVANGDELQMSTRHSVRPELQAEYDEALAEQNGDWMKQIVAQAAYEAGYTTGAYHGSPVKDITEFRTRSTETKKQTMQLLFGTHFTQSRDYASIYAKKAKNSKGTTRMTAKGEGRVYDVYLDLGKSLDLQTAKNYAPGSEMYQLYEDMPEAIRKRVPPHTFTETDTREGLGSGKFVTIAIIEKCLQTMSPKMATDFLVSHGYNSVKYLADYSTAMANNRMTRDPSIIMLDPERIKSGDPVTYDDNGEVIPLSQRFNVDEGDIRYSTKNTQTGTKQFKKWFGNSKVVDEDGNPLVVYHGTEADFTVFDRSKGRSTMDIQGMFFSPWEIEAEGYGSKVGAYYLSIQNPAPEGVAYKALNMFKGQNNAGVKAREYLEARGYDGVQGYDEWIAFRPEQIKSATDNIGTFDAKNPDVRYSVRSDNRTDRELLRDLYERTVAKERARAEKNEAGLKKAYQRDLKDKQSVIEELKAEQAKALDTFLKRQERYDSAMRAVSVEMTKLENLVNAGANQKAISEQRAKVTAAETRLANATAALTQARDSEAIQKILSRERQLQRDRTRNTIRESVNSREMKRRVTRAAGELYEMLAVNSDKLHVPEILKEPLGDFLQSLDFTSKRALAGGEETKADQRFGARLQQIRNILENQQRYLNGEEAAAQDLGGYLDISEDSLQFLRDCTDMINQALAENRGYTINQMNAEQLRDLANFLSNLKSAIRKMNSFLANERYASVREAADADITEMEAMGRARNLAENRALNEFLWKNGTPYYIFKRMGAGAESIFQGFARGWSQMAFDARKIIDFTEQAYTDKEVKQWKKETHDFTLEDGSKITMTTAQIMELSQLLGRQQAIQHLQAGGMRIGDIQTRTGAKGDTKHYHLTDGDLQQILGALSERQMAVARSLQHFMAEQGAEWGNEVSMKRFGYRFYTEGEGYYPIVTDALDRPMADTDAQKNSMFRLLNLSSSKSLNPKANNALVVGDIFDTFTDHMADMAKLHGMGLPILDAIKWFNFKEKTKNEDGTIDTRTLQGAMEQAFGSAAGSYFRTMMKDINGQTENGDRGTGLANMAMGAYKAQAVAANLRVALLQPTAYLRAATVLKPKYMLAAFGNFKASVFAVRAAEAAWKEAMQHSGEMIWKDIGGYDTDLSRSMRSQIQHSDSVKDKVVNGSMFLAEWGDKLTWGRLWAACKLQAKAENKALTGQALMEATEKIFREVIYSSQVMDSTLTRSELMRGKTMGSKILTAFMAEPTLSVNIVMDAASEYHNDTRKYGKAEAWKRNGKRIGKAFMIYLCTQTAAALVESLADAIRDDDDEEYWKKYLEALLGKDNAKRILGEELGKDAKSVFWSAYADGNLLQDYLFLNKLPFIKDLASLLTGFKSRNMMTEGAENLLNVYKIWRETKELADGVLDKATSVTYYGKMTPWGKIYKSLQAISQLTGTPLYGASRDVVAIWNTIMNGRKDEWKIRTYDPNALSQSKLNKYNELVAPTGVTKKDFQRITQEIDTNGNGSVSQAEAGPYLQAEEAAGRLTREQAAAVWSATTTGKATYEEWLGKQKLGKYGKGNIDLTDRDTGLYDSSGKLMTVKSISFEEDGQEILIPTIVKKNGKWVELSDDEAIDWYHKTGEYLGKFDSVSEANDYAQRLHLEQEKMYK